MFGGMAGRRMPAEFRRCARRVRNSGESRYGRLHGGLHAGPRAFYRHRCGHNLFSGAFSSRQFVSKYRAARRHRRNPNVAAHNIFAVLRNRPSRRFAHANGLRRPHARYRSAPHFVRQVSSVVGLARKRRAAARNCRRVSNSPRFLISFRKIPNAIYFGMSLKCVAMYHSIPNGSVTPPMRSPYGISAIG
jgi:hypothetical protein